MYITKLHQIPTESENQPFSISPSKLHHLDPSPILKKQSFLSERPHQTINQDRHQYSQTFREMMNKVLNRICKKNNFLRIKQKSPNSFIKDDSPKHTESQIYHSLSLQNKINKTKHGLSKLKIQGIAKPQNDSNLLKKTQPPRIYNKTSISFLKNKQFRKNIDLQKAKSMPSYGKISHQTQKQKENSSFLSNLERITFNNSFYPKVNEIKTAFDQTCKVDTIIPKFQIRENYQKMSEVFKKQLEPKHKKIELAKKLYHKKMARRQKHNDGFSQSFIEKPKIKVILTEKDEPRNEFEPWNTHEDMHEDMFKGYKRFPS